MSFVTVMLVSPCSLVRLSGRVLLGSHVPTPAFSSRSRRLKRARDGDSRARVSSSSSVRSSSGKNPEGSRVAVRREGLGTTPAGHSIRIDRRRSRLEILVSQAAFERPQPAVQRTHASSLSRFSISSSLSASSRVSVSRNSKSHNRIRLSTALLLASANARSARGASRSLKARSATLTATRS